MSCTFEIAVSNSTTYEFRIANEEAYQIIRSCKYKTSLLWPRELPNDFDEVYVKGAEVYANITGENSPVSLGSIGEIFKCWKSNAKKRVLAVGVGPRNGSICTVVFV